MFIEIAGLMTSLASGMDPVIDRLLQSPQVPGPPYRQRPGRNMQTEVITRIPTETRGSCSCLWR